jgi:hypothetical protein
MCTNIVSKIQICYLHCNCESEHSTIIADIKTLSHLARIDCIPMMPIYKQSKGQRVQNPMLSNLTCIEPKFAFIETIQMQNLQFNFFF